MVKNPLATHEILRNLVELCKNAERGFTLAEEGLTDGEAKKLFRRLAQDRARQAAELERELERQVPGEWQARADEEVCLPCAWTRIRSALNEQDEPGLIALCDEGTDLIERTYASALDTRHARPTRSLLERHLTEVRSSQEVLKALSRMD